MKSRSVCIKKRSTSDLLQLEGQVTKHPTVKMDCLKYKSCLDALLCFALLCFALLGRPHINKELVQRRKERNSKDSSSQTGSQISCDLQSQVVGEFDRLERQRKICTNNQVESWEGFEFSGEMSG